MQLAISGIADAQGLFVGLKHFYTQIDELNSSLVQFEDIPLKAVLVSMIEAPTVHFEDVSKRPGIKHLEVGFDEDVFRHPWDFDRMDGHLTQQVLFALGSSDLPEQFVRTVADWFLGSEP